MFPINFNISGHSGTAQKHRKAFDKAKEYYQKTHQKTERTSFSYNKVEQRKKMATSNKANLYIKLPLLMISLLFISLVISQSGLLLNQHHEEVQSISVASKAEDSKHAYLFHLEKGNRFLQAKMYDEAQFYYTKALNMETSLDKKEAKNGLNKTLQKMKTEV